MKTIAKPKLRKGPECLGLWSCELKGGGGHVLYVSSSLGALAQAVAKLINSSLSAQTKQLLDAILARIYSYTFMSRSSLQPTHATSSRHSSL